MASNDVALLRNMIDQARPATEAELDAAEHEAFFVAQKYFRRERPSTYEIMSGIVDGEKDCGIDGAYILVNGFFVSDDAPLSTYGRGSRLELVLFQIKNTTGFGEPAIDKLIVNLPKLLAFSRNEADLSRFANNKLIEITRRFLHAYMNIEMAQVSVKIAFGSLKADHVHPNTLIKAEGLEEVINQCFSHAKRSVEFLDAAAIADMARQPASIVRKFPLSENPISTNTEGGYIGVVRLHDYFRFITDATGKLDASLFEANVRDYEGVTDVNKSIQKSLVENDSTIDFWWLNNGVTIVADRVQPANKVLELESPQIVNGLQTSHEIHKLGANVALEHDDRSLLVKVIEAMDGATRDQIIRATNSQTALGSSALRATDKVQRQIEEILVQDGLFYERRKNQYLNKGHRTSDLVSINEMGQAILSQLAQTPHIARSEVSRIFEDDVYELLFSAAHPINLYPASIRISRHCRNFLREDPKTLPFIEDFGFHLMMLVAISATRKKQPKAIDIANCTELPSAVEMRKLLSIIRDEFGKSASRQNAVLFDQVAKDSSVTDGILARGRGLLNSTSRSERSVQPSHVTRKSIRDRSSRRR